MAADKIIRVIFAVCCAVDFASAEVFPHVLYADPTNVTEIDYPNSNITELGDNEFISYTALEGLSLMGNEIFTINTTAFIGTKLLVLNLTNNIISSIDANTFDCCPTMESLFLSSNQIASIAELGFPASLKILHLDNNMIASIDANTFDCCPTMESLFLSSNQIASIAEHVFPASLKILHLDDNLLTDYPPQNITSYVLNLANNLLTEFPSFYNEDGNDYTLDNNPIAVIDVQRLGNGRENVISLRKTLITTVPCELIKVCKGLYIQENDLMDLSLLAETLLTCLWMLPKKPASEDFYMTMGKVVNIATHETEMRKFVMELPNINRHLCRLQQQISIVFLAKQAEEYPCNCQTRHLVESSTTLGCNAEIQTNLWSDNYDDGDFNMLCSERNLGAKTSLEEIGDCPDNYVILYDSADIGTMHTINTPIDTATVWFVLRGSYQWRLYGEIDGQYTFKDLETGRAYKNLTDIVPGAYFMEEIKPPASELNGVTPPDWIEIVPFPGVEFQPIRYDYPGCLGDYYFKTCINIKSSSHTLSFSLEQTAQVYKVGVITNYFDCKELYNVEWFVNSDTNESPCPRPGPDVKYCTFSNSTTISDSFSDSLMRCEFECDCTSGCKLDGMFFVTVSDHKYEAQLCEVYLV